MTTRILAGDCRDVLATLPEKSVQMCVTSPPYFGLRSYLPDSHDHKQHEIGAEPTVQEYVGNLVAVFREVRRVLRDDGVLWCNLGDSFGPGKQLLGVPWRVAFALQDDGWILRSDVIWHKPNPMPESVTDRPTKAHEYLFLLAKQPRYYYDAAAIAEDDAGLAGGRQRAAQRRTFEYADKDYKSTHVGNGNSGLYASEYTGKRNKRSVWTVATQPFSGSHFAVFPPKLIEPCILAGSREGDTVLDPFSGSGTTGMVAARFGRDFIGIDLNPDNVQLSKSRIEGDAPLFNRVDIHDACDTTDTDQSGSSDHLRQLSTETLETA